MWAAKLRLLLAREASNEHTVDAEVHLTGEGAILTLFGSLRLQDPEANLASLE